MKALVDVKLVTNMLSLLFWNIRRKYDSSKSTRPNHAWILLSHSSILLGDWFSLQTVVLFELFFRYCANRILRLYNINGANKKFPWKQIRLKFSLNQIKTFFACYILNRKFSSNVFRFSENKLPSKNDSISWKFFHFELPAALKRYESADDHHSRRSFF